MKADVKDLFEKLERQASFLEQLWDQNRSLTAIALVSIQDTIKALETTFRQEDSDTDKLVSLIKGEE